MKKKFDAVAFQRAAREELGKEYLKDRKRFVDKLSRKYSKSPKQVHVR